MIKNITSQFIVASLTGVSLATCSNNHKINYGKSPEKKNILDNNGPKYEGFEWKKKHYYNDSNFSKYITQIVEWNSCDYKKFSKEEQEEIKDILSKIIKKIVEEHYKPEGQTTESIINSLEHIKNGGEFYPKMSHDTNIVSTDNNNNSNSPSEINAINAPCILAAEMFFSFLIEKNKNGTYILLSEIKTCSNLKDYVKQIIEWNSCDYKKYSKEEQEKIEDLLSTMMKNIVEHYKPENQTTESIINLLMYIKNGGEFYPSIQNSDISNIHRFASKIFLSFLSEKNKSGTYNLLSEITQPK